MNEEYLQNIQRLCSVFGRPSEPYVGKVYSKIKKHRNGTFSPMVKHSFFERWKYLRWQYYDEQPNKGFTKRRSVITKNAECYHEQKASELLWEYLEFRGGGVTIW